MRQSFAITAAFLALALSGCVLRGKTPKAAPVAPVTAKPVTATAPPPPPPPLSTPQTQVELPRPQPIDPAALATEPPVEIDLPPEPASAPRANSGRRAAAPPQRTTETAPPAA